MFRIFVKSNIFMLLFISLANTCCAQTITSTPIDATTNKGGDNVAGPVSLLSNYEFGLTIIILIFGACSIMCSSWVLSKSNKTNPDHLIKLITVNLIIIGSLVTISAGFNDQQMAPAFGLFGTIAGYLLGRSERNNREPTSPEKE